MEIGVSNLVVRKPGGGLVMVVHCKGDDGRLFCVSVDRAKTVKAWFDPSELKLVNRRPLAVLFH